MPIPRFSASGKVEYPQRRNFLDSLRESIADVPVTPEGDTEPDSPQARTEKALTAYGLPLLGAGIAAAIAARHGHGIEAGAAFLAGNLSAATKFGMQHRNELLAEQEQRRGFRRAAFPALDEASQNQMLKDEGVQGRVAHQTTPEEQAAMSAGLNLAIAGMSSPNPGDFSAGVRTLARVSKMPQLEEYASMLDGLTPERQEQARKLLDAAVSQMPGIMKRDGAAKAIEHVRSLAGTALFDTAFKGFQDTYRPESAETSANVALIRARTATEGAQASSYEAQAALNRERMLHPEKFYPRTSQNSVSGMPGALKMANDDFYRQHAASLTDWDGKKTGAVPDSLWPDYVNRVNRFRRLVNPDARLLTLPEVVSERQQAASDTAYGEPPNPWLVP